MYNRIELPLAPSRLSGTIAAAPWLLLALATLIAAGFTSPWLALAVVPALAGARDAWRRCGSLAHARALVRLDSHHGRLFATLASGVSTEVRVRPDSRLSGQLLYLALEDLQTGGRLSAVLLPREAGGNAPASALRRLRCCLRLMPGLSDPIDVSLSLKNALRRLRTRHDH